MTLSFYFGLAPTVDDIHPALVLEVLGLGFRGTVDDIDPALP